MRIKMIASLSILALLAACGSNESPADDNVADANPASDNLVDTEFRQEFLKSCNQSSTQAGVEEAMANQICACSADALIDEYSMAERAMLSSDKMDAVLERCLKKSGITPA